MDLITFRNKNEQSGSLGTMLPVRSAAGVRSLSVLEFAALLPPAGVAVFERGIGWFWILFTATLVALLWQRIFAEMRRRPFNPDGLIPVIACSIILPATAPLWHVALSLSFGIVVGQEIYGGRGRNFLNTATVALAFFIFSFPGKPLEELSPAMGLSVIPGALLIFAGGLISWRVMIGAAVGLLLTSLAIAAGLPAGATSLAGFAFGLVFLAADPIAAASTNPGRWIYGLVFGGVAALLAGGGAPSMDVVVSAALLSSILAPLVDNGVLALKTYHRERRHG
ncbi:MAG: hypothetical protein GY789_29650 [Hyphomicrobiales bacterium]|nr:hypothetical protein [Hyphomicrobiales bacterium]